MSIVRVQKNSSNPYVMIDKKVIQDNSLSINARFILIYMLSMPDTWEFHLNEVASHFGDHISHRTIRRVFKELIQSGYLVKNNSRKGNGLFKCHFYDLNEHPIPIGPKTTSSTRPKSDMWINGQHSNNERSKQINTERKKINKKEPSSSQATALPSLRSGTCDQPSFGFEVFWKAWPGGKKSRSPALKAWIKLKPPLDVCLKAIERLQEARSMLVASNVWVAPLPLPTTWLNQERWNDEISIDDTKKQIRESLSGKFQRFTQADMEIREGYKRAFEGMKPEDRSNTTHLLTSCMQMKK